jgi:polyhydroxyalkanoate synthesis regulator phasin
MIDLIKKAALTGIGVASLTSEKIEEISKDLIDKSKMSEQEGEKFVQEMLTKAEESRTSLKNQIEKMVGSALAKVQFAKNEDISELKDEIEKLRQEIKSLKEDEQPPE